MRSIIWVTFAGFVSYFGTAVAATDGPFDEEVLKQAFELSKTCPKKCANESVGMVRLPIQGKVAFLIGTNDLGYCGSGGCASLVVVVSGSKFLTIKEGQGITENQAISLVTGAGDPASFLAGKPSFDCSKASSASARLICGDPDLSKADGLLGAKFRTAANTNEAAKSQLVEQQVIWIRARNSRCGVGPDKAKVALEQLLASKACMLEAINARIAELGARQSEQLASTTAAANSMPQPPRSASTPASAKQAATNQSASSINQFAVEGQRGAFGSAGPNDHLFVGFNFRKANSATNGTIFCTSDSSGRASPFGSATHVYIHLANVEHTEFATDALAETSLNAIRELAKNRCEAMASMGQLQGPQRNPIGPSQIPQLYDVGGHGGGVAASAASYEARWSITGNWPKQNAQQQLELQRRQQVFAQERQREIDAKAALRNKFASDFKIQAWVDDQRLGTNPFIYKNQVIAVQTVFAQMLSESEGLFADNQPLYVSGLPSTLFAGKARVFLALRVQGTKTIKIATGEITVPYGDYVGVYACQQTGCNEFVGQ